MKKLIFLFALAVYITACNKVEFPNKDHVSLVDVSDTIFPDTNLNIIRHVLVEEFTGQTCGPCPGGAEQLRNMFATYATAGQELIIVSIHEGSQAAPHVLPDTTFPNEYRVASGSYLANTYFNPNNLPATPAALINRVPYPTATDIWIYRPDWQSAADAQFALPNVMNLDMVATFNTTSNSGTVAVRAMFLDTLSSDYYLKVYLVQDSIVNWQKNGPLGQGDDFYPLNQDISNYVHRHVYRGCLSNEPTGDGIQISTGLINKGTKVIKAFNFSLAQLKDATHENILSVNYPAFDPSHFIFVAFVYDHVTKQVIQVIEQELE